MLHSSRIRHNMNACVKNNTYVSFHTHIHTLSNSTHNHMQTQKDRIKMQRVTSKSMQIQTRRGNHLATLGYTHKHK